MACVRACVAESADRRGARSCSKISTTITHEVRQVHDQTIPISCLAALDGVPSITGEAELPPLLHSGSPRFGRQGSPKLCHTA